MSEQLSPELDLSVDELAMIYALKGWEWDVGNEVRTPNGDEIHDLILILGEQLEKSSKGTWAGLGRLIVYKDPEFPSSWGIALELGYMDKEVNE